jgi:2-iminobutanoate/2-iminopropanoate deaminase
MADVTRTVIRTDGAPSSPLYAQGISAGGTIYVSGTVGTDPATGQFAGPSVQEQLRQAVANCANVLAAGGSSLGDVLEVGVLLADPGDFVAMNRAYADLFGVEPPARYVAQLGAAVPGLRVSVRMIAQSGPTESSTASAHDREVRMRDVYRAACAKGIATFRAHAPLFEVRSLVASDSWPSVKQLLAGLAGWRATRPRAVAPGRRTHGSREDAR